MAEVHSRILPNTYLFLRLPNDVLRLIEIKPNTTIEIGKLGSFPANLLLDRPYHTTYELLEPRPHETFSRLRVISPHELNADVLAEDGGAIETENGTNTPLDNGTPINRESSAHDPTAELKNNRLTVDDPARQGLTQVEIEELKRTAGGQEIIDRILANHAGIDEKTAFSRAKYLLRKRNKYLKRFTVLPMEIPMLMQYIGEREPQRILDIRDESLGLITAWSNVHVAGTEQIQRDASNKRTGGGRWLAVEESGGLIVAAMAERMQILYPTTEGHDATINDGSKHTSDEMSLDEVNDVTSPDKPAKTPVAHEDFLIPAEINTITLIHSAIQPNISLLKYFGYDSNEPNTKHPLHKHLKPLSWLQLLHPEEDPTYMEPAEPLETELKEWKSGKRGAYWRKRRRWQRCASIVDETREGGFDGLVVATPMDPIAILQHTIPLLRGGASVVVYSATADVLVRLMDLYSKERRTAYVQHLIKGETPDADDFPLDPRLLLVPTLQTSRVRSYQVLPGRTHPFMTQKGGPEGYVFTARKAIPLEGGVEARGNHGAKRRKTNASGDA